MDKKTAHSERLVTGVSHPFQAPNTPSWDPNYNSTPMSQRPPSTDHNWERVARRRLPTVNEAINWMTEEWLQRELFGFSLGNYSTSELLFKDMSVDPTARPYVSDSDVTSAIEEMHASISLVRHRAEIVGVNKPLKESVNLELNRRILALSSSPEGTSRRLAKSTLTQKIAALYSVEHPIPKLPADSVIGFVSLKPLPSHQAQVNLPIKASLADVYSMLKSLLLTQQAALSTRMGESYDEKTLWTYRFVLGKTPMIDKPAVPLLSDLDYRIMISELVRKRIPGLTTVLLEREGVGAARNPTRNREASTGGVSISGVGKAKGYKTEVDESKVCLSSIV